MESQISCAIKLKTTLGEFKYDSHRERYTQRISVNSLFLLQLKYKYTRIKQNNQLTF